MGQSVSNFFSDYCPDTITNVYSRIGQKRKRNISENEDELLLEKSLHLPKKVKLACTTEYIYKELFVEGKGCDIYVYILGKEWKLHKIYLQQSPYFASMFSGSWNESNKSHITIEVVDSNITEKSLAVVLGSLYCDEPSIEPCNVVSILAAATLLQMDGLIEQCINVMVENISPLTAMDYYLASCQYGIQRVKSASKEWFNVNLMTFYPDHLERLREVDIDLMAELVSSYDLIVIASEYSLYVLLRLWMFLRLNPKLQLFIDPDPFVIKDFYRNRSDKKNPFLLTPEGSPFIKVFKSIHIQDLLLHLEDMKSVIEDCIFPECWLYPQILSRYQTVLKVFQSLDKGPTAELPPEEFLKTNLRCGRFLLTADSHPWRWSLFTFGVHLNWSVKDNALSVQRVHKENDHLSLIENNTWQFLVRVKVITLNTHRQIKKSMCSGLVLASLRKSEELKLLDLGKDIDYPLIISINILFVTPEKTPQLDIKENNTKQK